MKRVDRKRADRFLHKLWTEHVGTEGYDKKEWGNLEQAIWTNPKKDEEEEADESLEDE